MTRVRVAAAGLLLLTAACGAAPGPGSISGHNVTGVLDFGPRPTCPSDEPCDLPARATNLVFTGAGGGEVRVRVFGSGHFSLHLDPGQYSITTAPPPFGGRVEPSTVEVPQTGSVYLRLRIARSP